MSLGVYPVFDPPLPDVSFDCDGSDLVRNFETLDELAESSGLRAFSSFGDNRSIPDDFDGSPDELDEILGPWDEWFDPQDGLRVVEALLQAFVDADCDEDLQRLRENSNVEMELQELATCLRAAAASDSRFRLEIG